MGRNLDWYVNEDYSVDIEYGEYGSGMSWFYSDTPIVYRHSTSTDTADESSSSPDLYYRSDLNILYSIQAIDGKLYSNLENVTSEREALRYERGESQKYAVPDTPESESISRKGGFSFMSKDKVIDSMGRIDDDMIQSVDALRRKKKRPSWLKWGAMAACLCLVLACAIPTIFRAPVDSPMIRWVPVQLVLSSMTFNI